MRCVEGVKELSGSGWVVLRLLLMKPRMVDNSRNNREASERNIPLLPLQ